MQRPTTNARRNMPELAIVLVRALIGLRPPSASVVKLGIKPQVRASR